MDEGAKYRFFITVAAIVAVTSMFFGYLTYNDISPDNIVGFAKGGVSGAPVFSDSCGDGFVAKGELCDFGEFNDGVSISSLQKKFSSYKGNGPAYVCSDLCVSSVVEDDTLSIMTLELSSKEFQKIEHLIVSQSLAYQYDVESGILNARIPSRYASSYDEYVYIQEDEPVLDNDTIIPASLATDTGTALVDNSLFARNVHKMAVGGVPLDGRGQISCISDGTPISVCSEYNSITSEKLELLTSVKTPNYPQPISGPTEGKQLVTQFTVPLDGKGQFLLIVYNATSFTFSESRTLRYPETEIICSDQEPSFDIYASFSPKMPVKYSQSQYVDSSHLQSIGEGCNEITVKVSQWSFQDDLSSIINVYKYSPNSSCEQVPFFYSFREQDLGKRGAGHGANVVNSFLAVAPQAKLIYADNFFSARLAQLFQTLTCRLAAPYFAGDDSYEIASQSISALGIPDFYGPAFLSSTYPRPFFLPSGNANNANLVGYGGDSWFNNPLNNLIIVGGSEKGIPTSQRQVNVTYLLGSGKLTSYTVSEVHGAYLLVRQYHDLVGTDEKNTPYVLNLFSKTGKPAFDSITGYTYAIVDVEQAIRNEQAIYEPERYIVAGTCGDAVKQANEACDFGYAKNTGRFYSLTQSTYSPFSYNELGNNVAFFCNDACESDAVNLLSTQCGDEIVQTSNNEQCDFGEYNGGFVKSSLKTQYAKYTGTGDSYTCSNACLSTVIQDPGVAASSYSQYKFEITGRKGATNSIQLSELNLYKDGSEINYVGSSIYNPGGYNPDKGTEDPEYAFDNSVNTKFLDFNFASSSSSLTGSSNVIISLANPVNITSYSFTTANDRKERDPVSWNLFGSRDGVSWDLLDSRSDMPVTDLRKVETPIYSLFSVPVDPEPVCGDGVVDSSSEQCDYGDVLNGGFNDGVTLSDNRTSFVPFSSPQPGDVKNGFKCTDTCVSLSEPIVGSSVCVDSDAGSVFVPGEVTDGSSSYIDSCALYEIDYDLYPSKVQYPVPISDNVRAYEDSCIGRFCKLQEFSCSANGQVEVSNVVCDNGCYNNACLDVFDLDKFCVDSDGGYNLSVAGGTTVNGVTNADKCWDSVLGSVSSCSGDSCFVSESVCYLVGDDSKSFNERVGTKHYSVPCPGGCSFGACVLSVPEPVCGDGAVDSPEVCEVGSTSSCSLNGVAGLKSCKSDCSGWNGCVVSDPVDDLSGSLIRSYSADNVVGDVLLDGSSMGYNAVLSNGVVVSSFPSLVFDGVDDFVNMSNIILSNNHDYSLAFWIKPFGGDMNIFEERVHSADTAVYLENGVLEFGTWRLSPRNIRGSAIVSGSWSNIVVVVDGVNMMRSVYVNGELINSASFTRYTRHNGFWTAFGRADTGYGWTGGLDNYYKGELSSLDIYDKALSVSEVQNKYLREKNNYSN